MDGGFGLLVPFVVASGHSIVYLLLIDHSSTVPRAVPNDLVISQTVAVITGGYFMMFFFATGITMNNIGLYIHIVSDTLVTVIMPFAAVYVILLLPHVTALLIQFLRTEEVPEYADIGAAVGKMWVFAMSGMSFEDLEAGRDAVSFTLSAIIMVVYNILVYVLLLNLLIAVLSGKIEIVQSSSLLHLRMRKARIVLWLEGLLPTSLVDLRVGDRLPPDQAFRIVLEELASRQKAEYNCLKIVVRINEWDVATKWTCTHTVSVKRLLLDACMKRPNYLRKRLLKPEAMAHTLKRFHEKYAKERLERVFLRDFGEEVLGLQTSTHTACHGFSARSSTGGIDQLNVGVDWELTGEPDGCAQPFEIKQVLATVEDMALAYQCREVDYEQKKQLNAKYPLWRGGCFVTGGDPLVDVVQSEEAVMVSLAIYIPAWSSYLAWYCNKHWCQLKAWRRRHAVFSAFRGSEEDGQCDVPALSHIASMTKIVERLYLHKFRTHLKQFLMPHHWEEIDKGYRRGGVNDVSVEIVDESIRALQDTKIHKCPDDTEEMTSGAQLGEEAGEKPGSGQGTRRDKDSDEEIIFRGGTRRGIRRGERGGERSDEETDFRRCIGRKKKQTRSKQTRTTRQHL